MDLPRPCPTGAAAVSELRLHAHESDLTQGGTAGHPLPRSAAYLRNAGTGKWHGYENPLRYAGPCVCGDNAGHLHPHHRRYAAGSRRQHRPEHRQDGAAGRSGAGAERHRGLPALCGEEKETRHRLRQRTQ